MRLQHQSLTGARASWKGIVNPGNVCCREPEVSSAGNFRGVLRSGSFRYGK
jgi:hypothetical protein